MPRRGMAETAATASKQQLRVPPPVTARWFAFAHRLSGYHIAEELGIDIHELAERQVGAYRATGEWPGSLLELRLVLFREARALRMSDGLADSLEHGIMVASLLNAIAAREDERHREGYKVPLGAPTRFEASVGGHFGSSYSVGWEGGRLVYDAVEWWDGSRSDERVAAHTRRFLRPSGAQWRRFNENLDRLEAWAWERQYRSPVLDGTLWEVAIEVSDMRLRTAGVNAYPPGGKSEPTTEFRGLLRGIRTLLGGGLPFS